jgi:anti-sigma B factor antagonist
MQSNFAVETRRTGQTTTLMLSGELDLMSSPQLEEALSGLDGGGWTESMLVVLDLRGIEFMDSTGLHVLVAARQRAEESGRRLALIRGGEQVHRLLDLTGIAELFTIVDSPEELLEAGRASD